MKWENIQREFKGDIMNVFTDEGNHTFFEASSKKNSTYGILLKAQNLDIKWGYDYCIGIVYKDQEQ